MCEICEMRCCPPACPNYETAAIGVCAYCGDVIYDGEAHLREVGDGRLFHAECLEGLSPADLLELFNIEVEVES